MAVLFPNFNVGNNTRTLNAAMMQILRFIAASCTFDCFFLAAISQCFSASSSARTSHSFWDRST